VHLLAVLPVWTLVKVIARAHKRYPKSWPFCKQRLLTSNLVPYPY
jgi:hypothetical protein